MDGAVVVKKVSQAFPTEEEIVAAVGKAVGRPA